ncbi:MAG: HutD family protein [Lysobacteraceae bacterium]
MIELMPANAHRREPWRNGGGWTREIARSPSEGNWDWRLSVADVGRDGPFSRFEGCDREIVLLAGQGMDLEFEDGERVALRPPHGRLRFAGERALSARLVEGPTLDLNLIWRRDPVDMQVFHRPIVGSMLFFGEPGVDWLLYVVAGRVHTPAGGLDAGDAARFVIAPGQRVVIDGGGELFLARVRRRLPDD